MKQKMAYLAMPEEVKMYCITTENNVAVFELWQFAYAYYVAMLALGRNAVLDFA